MTVGGRKCTASSYTQHQESDYCEGISASQSLPLLQYSRKFDTILNTWK